MAKKIEPEYEIPRRPSFSTEALPPLGGGRMRGVNGCMMAWFKVPLSSVTDTKDAEFSRAAGDQLDSFFRGLASLSSGMNRRMARSSYRDFHLLWLGIPTWFEPPAHLATSTQLQRWFYDKTEQRLELLIGIPLRASARGQSFIESFSSVFETFKTGRAPTSDFDQDYELILDLAARSGLEPASNSTLRWADAWYNHGVPKSVPIVLCEEHIHMFKSSEARREVEKYHDVADCRTWRDIDGQSAMTFAVADGFDYNDETVPVEDEFVRFGPELARQGARVISIRGSIEPAKITRQELASQSRQHGNDVQASMEAGKKARGEVEQHIRFLDELEDLYAKSRDAAPPTLVDVSMIVGFDGIIENVDRIQAGPVTLLPASDIAGAAWYETMICSSVRANPIMLELPSTSISYGGLQDRSRVGDDPNGNVALAGFTPDRQPVWLSPSAASVGDTYPYLGILGATGSGKQCVLSTRIPTPAGWTTFGEVQVGDEVLGRDGKPCKVVHVSDIDDSPELYRLRFSDGQTIIADANHQWVVRSNSPIPAARATFADSLDVAALESGEATTATPSELYQRYADELPWKGGFGVEHALRMMDVDFEGGRVAVRAALHALASRIRQRMSGERLLRSGELLLTTAEMIEFAESGASFSLDLSHPVELPEVDSQVVACAVDSDNPEGSLQAISVYHRGSVSQRAALLNSVIPAGEHVTAPLTREVVDGLAGVARSLGLLAEVVSSGDFARMRVSKEQSLQVKVIEPVAQDDPDYESARCISVDSSDQVYLAADFVPTHNTMLAQWLSWQWSVNGAPVLFFDPKPDSDLSSIAMLAGGKVTSVDTMVTSDGVLDPLRYSDNPMGEIALATSICGIALGREQHRYETEMTRAISYGVERGEKGIGLALKRALADNQVSRELYDKIMSVSDSSPMFRATFAVTPGGTSLSVDDAFTLIKLGRTNLRLPKRGTTTPIEMEPLEIRLSVNLARMIVRAGITALRGRGGVLMMDEAWVLDLAAPDELEEVGRLARQFHVLPVYMSQTPSSVVNGGLSGYFSRGLVGHLKRAAGEGAPDEPQAAMDLFGISDQQIKTRIQAEDQLPGDAGTNWNTLKAIWDNPNSPERTLLRSPQFYHSDLKNSIAPTTVEVPLEFVELASTNPEDVKRRLARQQGG